MSTQDFTDLGQAPASNSTPATPEKSNDTSDSFQEFLDILKEHSCKSGCSGGSPILKSIIMSNLSDSKPAKDITAAEARQLSLEKHHEKIMGRIRSNVTLHRITVQIDSVIVNDVAEKLRAAPYSFRANIENANDTDEMVNLRIRWA
jgi:hypothetical protein